jgi:hypothetical protein
LRLAVTVAVWLLVIVPAVTVNVLLLCPEAIVTLPGVVSCELLSDSETDVALVAFLFSVAVQVEDCALFRVDGEQAREESCTGTATRLTVVVRFTPPALAVITAL